MTSTSQSSFRVVPPTDTPDATAADDQDMTEKTAAKLRDLCREKGEPFDTALTEAQAQERIAALKDMG